MTEIVCVGGGHGLSATLMAMNIAGFTPTAVVGTADDGGSSGKLRKMFGCIPPGDLRMALTALLPLNKKRDMWDFVLTRRFDEKTFLSTHPVGNLLLVQLLNHFEAGEALKIASDLIGINGCVLPATSKAVELRANVIQRKASDESKRDMHHDSNEIQEIVGQVAIAQCVNEVVDIHLHPKANIHPLVKEKIMSADIVTIGPGSWWTSVIAPLKVSGMIDALCETKAEIVVFLNLGQELGETQGYKGVDHLNVLFRTFPNLPVNYVIADSKVSNDVRVFCDKKNIILCCEDLAIVDTLGNRSFQLHDPKKMVQIVKKIIKGGF